MKRFGAVLMAVLIAVSAFAAIPANAATENEVVLKYTPKLDGKLDAAYLQSFYINHEWPAERNSQNYWGNGKFAFTDLQKDENGNTVDGSVGYITSYGWDLQASSYFLWDDDNLYIAVNVTDDDYGCIDDAHYKMSAEDSSNLGPWLQDAINIALTYKGMTFTIRADRAGRYASVFREDNYYEQVWCDMYSWFEHTKNKDAGYFATAETGRGYLIELKIPVSENVKAKVLKDGGNFKFGLTVADAGANSPYGLDQARLGDGIEVEGYQLEDFMVHHSCLNPVDNKPDQKVKLSEQTPDVENMDAVIDSNGNEVIDTTPGVTGNNTGATGSGDPSAPTGDIGIAVAAAALVAGACFIALKKKR